MYWKYLVWNAHAQPNTDSQWVAYILGHNLEEDTLQRQTNINMVQACFGVSPFQYVFEFLEKTPELLLDIEFISDKGWYTECPRCERCLYKGIDVEHCEC